MSTATAADNRVMLAGLTNRSDEIRNYLQKNSCKFVHAVSKKKGEMLAATTLDNVILGPHRYDVPEYTMEQEPIPTIYTVKEDLFTLTPAQMSDLNINTLGGLKILHSFVATAMTVCPQAIAHMKNGDFRLFTKSQEDLLRVRTLVKEFPNKNITFELKS